MWTRMIHISENLYIKYFRIRDFFSPKYWIFSSYLKKNNCLFFWIREISFDQKLGFKWLHIANKMFPIILGWTLVSIQNIFGIGSNNYLIHRHKKKRRIDQAIKSVIVETANNVTSSLLDFSPIMMMMILVANGPDPRQDKSFESDLIWAQMVTELFKT